MCREGHEDMASIRLKKILAQNPKLIKGYHLLALIQMKNQEWNKARRTLRKAARIDKTNTTTLRFLREVDEQTGVTTKMENRRKSLLKSNAISKRKYYSFYWSLIRYLKGSISGIFLIPASHYLQSSQKVTALAAATFRLSTPGRMGMRTV